MYRLTIIALIAAFCFFCHVGADLGNGDRIVGGEKASINEFPYIVSIQEKKSHVCGGSILSQTLILTAAHCLEGVNKDSHDLQVRAGSGKHDSGGAVKDVKDFIIHPLFNGESMEYDLAFLKLASPLVYSNTIKAVEISDIPVTDGSKAMVCGWGLTKNNGKDLSPDLKKTVLTTMTMESCWNTGYGKNIKPSMFCARGEDTDACEGDSGGPIVDVDTDKLIGVVSFGFDCNSKKYPGVYTLLSKCLAFITKSLKTL